MNMMNIDDAVYSKRNAHLISIFFVAPLMEGGAKIYMVDYVSSPGGPQKNSELNVCFFWNRLYILNKIYR